MLASFRSYENKSGHHVEMLFTKSEKFIPKIKLCRPRTEKVADENWGIVRSKIRLTHFYSFFVLQFFFCFYSFL